MAKDSKQGNGTKIALAIAGIVIVALVAVVVVLLVRGKKDENEPKRNVVVTQENAEQVAEEMVQQEYVEPGYYNTQMSMEWHFATGDAVSEDAYVKNDAGNTNDVFFDVFLSEDESTPILESPVIPRGAELDNISLDKPLDAGTHDCIMVYHLVDDNQETISTLRIRFTIIVEQ